MKKYPKLSKELFFDFNSLLNKDWHGNRERIAFRMKCSTRTIERWASGATSPSPVESEKLRRIINGMRWQTDPILSNAKGIKIK